MIILACALFFHSDLNSYFFLHSLMVNFSEGGHLNKKSGAACFISLDKEIVKTNMSPRINIIIIRPHVRSKTAFTLSTVHTIHCRLQTVHLITYFIKNCVTCTIIYSFAYFYDVVMSYQFIGTLPVVSPDGMGLSSCLPWWTRHGATKVGTIQDQHCLVQAAQMCIWVDEIFSAAECVCFFFLTGTPFEF